MMRIGHGYDVHKFADNRKCIIGGVDIPYEMGPLGHSDADVLLHAIADALLGAAAMGDIGHLFPDTDETYKNADSLVLLSKTVEAVKLKGYKIGNIDATVIAQAPKMAPFIDEMRKNIAKACNCDVDCISVKATTEEGLGFTGSKQGIAAHAVCIIE
ncbi:MAG: 2-C-methyl-D-erythritol 2,4-cyclodiphosphate synthase [Eubacterium sp.]|nr:2-C-methyl-D-erythritol 2,4-cyclodiphosphate synthase [Eubacterium sp.]